jgi:ADP-heptose:LPS heptosyltransferase
MPGTSTLPNRYPRVKAAIACVAAEDVQQMLKSVKAIDAAIEAEHKEVMAKKWTRVAKHMKENGVETEYVVS